jgi:hypothetical protein
MIFPLYYVPANVPPPAHIVGFHSVVSNLRPGYAPDGVHEEVAAFVPDRLNPEVKLGGKLIGAATLDDQTRSMFKPTSAGWWVAMGHIAPHTLARVRKVPGRVISGVDPDHEWHVPTLLHIDSSSTGTKRLTSAIPAIYKDYQWQTPAEFHAVIDRLGNYIRAEETPPREEALALAVEILAINYHISIHEIAVAGWMNEAFLLRVIEAAIDLSE